MFGFVVGDKRGGTSASVRPLGRVFGSRSSRNAAPRPQGYLLRAWVPDTDTSCQSPVSSLIVSVRLSVSTRWFSGWCFAPTKAVPAPGSTFLTCTTCPSNDAHTQEEENHVSRSSRRGRRQVCAASATDRDGHAHAMGELLVAMSDNTWKDTYCKLRTYWEAEAHVSLADDADSPLSDWVRPAVPFEVESE